MEFKFRAAQDLPLKHSSSSSTIGSLSEQALRGVGYLHATPTQNAELTAREVLQRQIEKARIREEIIEEFEKRRALEAEIRRELIIEEEVAMRGMSFEERLAVRLNPRLFKLLSNEFDNRSPFLGLPALKAQPARKDDEDTLILLAKLNSNLRGAKHEAATPPAGDPSELPFAGLKKKPPAEEWSCALCQVSAPCEKGLNDHLQGKKHKAKEAELRTQKLAKKKLPKENEMKQRSEFWCKICGIRANSAEVMESHKKGKKHLAELQKQNGKVVPSNPFHGTGR